VEPWGPWPDDLVAGLCDELDLSHAADPFLRRSVTPLAYYWLHGITGARHVYTDDESGTLRATVGDGSAHVMFNNLAVRARRAAIRGIGGRLTSPPERIT